MTTSPLALVALVLAPQVAGPLALPEELTGQLAVEQLEARLDGGLEVPAELREGLGVARLLASGALEVPEEEATALLEELLDVFGLGLFERGADATPRYELFELQRAHTEGVPTRELPVEVLDALGEEHPALQVLTTLRPEGFDARAWFNTLRPFFADAARLNGWPAADGGGLVVRGTAARVARFAGLIGAVFEGGPLGAPAPVVSGGGWSPRSGESFLELARSYTRASGEVLLFHLPAPRLDERAPLELPAGLELSAAQAPRALEELALERGLVLTTLHAGARRVTLVDRPLERGLSLRMDAQPVDERHLDALAAQPARLFVARLRCDGARALSNAARAAVDRNLELLLPLPGDEAMLVLARGESVLRWRERFALASGAGAAVETAPPAALRAPLVVAPDEHGTVSASELLEALRAASGAGPRLRDADGVELARRRLVLSQPIEPPPEAAWPVAEALLGELDLSLVPGRLSGVGESLAVVDRARSLPAPPSWLVPPRSLGAWTERRACELECLLSVPAGGARRFVNALRGLRLEGVVVSDLGADERLWARGPASGVAWLAGMEAATRGEREVEAPGAPWPCEPVRRLEPADRERVRIPLDELALEYGRATGQVVVLRERLARSLANHHVELAALRDLPTEALPVAFERELRARGLTRVELTGPPLRVVTLRLEPRAQDARYVPLERVDDCAAHPATFYTSVYRPSARGLRELLAALPAPLPATAQALPFEGGPALLLRAYGDELPALVAALRAADR